MARLRIWLAGLSPWRARMVAFTLGALAVFAMPPVYQIYLLVPAFTAFAWQASDAPSKWRAFVIGWWFGAGFFTAGLYWVSFALLVDGDKFAWLIPFAVFGFAFGMGLFCALAALAVRCVSGPMTARVLVLAGAWTLLEWVRSWLFTGFPWNPLGSVWAFSDILLQGAAVVGVFGLSLLTVLFAAAPAALTHPGRAPRVLLGGLVVIGLVWVGGGVHRLSTASDDVVPGVRLRLVQPNIAQNLKWRADLREAHMLSQIDSGLAPPVEGGSPPTHVIWAETNAPFFIADFPAWRRLVGSATPPGGLTILGAPRRLPSEGAGQNSNTFRVANSLLALDQHGDVRAHYDKFHLVPFGEYVPLSDWLPLDKITQGAGAFTPGPGPQTLSLPGLPPVSPLICYEIIFPGQVIDSSERAAEKPRWLLNLTNDAWYGQTAGPYQHFVTARFRAVEQGLPTVRVAGTGISGIVDAYGRVRQQLALGEKGFVDGDLPVAAPRINVYARTGNALPVGWAVLVVLSGLGIALRARKT